MQDLFQPVLELFQETKPELVQMLKEEAIKICHEKGTVCADDLRIRFGEISDDKRIYGTVFRDKRLQLVTYTKSKIKTSHGRPIGVFKIKEV